MEEGGKRDALVILLTTVAVSGRKACWRKGERDTVSWRVAISG